MTMNVDPRMNLSATASRGWLAVLVAVLVMASTLSSTHAQRDYPLGEFMFEESAPSFGGTGYSNTAEFGDRGYVNTANFGDTGYGDTADFGDRGYIGTADFGDSGYSDNAGFGYTGYSDTADVGGNAEADEMEISAAVPAGAFVKTRGQQFVVNGKPHFVNGANLYYLMTYGSQLQSRKIVTDILRESAGVGVNVVRAWAFADGDGNYNLQMRPGVYSETTFRGLDFAVAEARKFGIRVILSLVNNYPDYGGRQQYVKWAQGAGNWNAKLDDFYSDGAMRQWYRNHIKRVVTRVNTFTGVAYRDDPTIFAWELINEPRCESDRSGNKLQRWIREMSAYVKSLDRKHMVEVGLEGFYSAIANPSSVNSQNANPATYAANFGTDFILNGQPAEIDFTTVHAYPDHWLPQGASDAQKRNFMASWIKTHTNDAKYRLKKPVLFAEFGRSDRVPGYKLQHRINDMTDMFNAVYASAKSGGPAAGAMVWQLLPRALKYNHQDGFGIVLSENPTIATIMSKQSYRMSRL